MYNFRLHIRRAITWGLPVNGSTDFDGICGMIERQEVDFGANVLTYTPARHRILDSGLSVFKFRQVIVFRHPVNSKGLRNVFLAPLLTETWLVLLGVVVLSIVVLYMSYWYDKYRHRTDEGNFMITFITTISIMAQQGTTLDRFTSFQVKIVLFFMIILSFCWFQFYSSSIVGTLLSPPPRTITTLKALTRSDLKIILEDVPTSVLVFKVSVNEDLLEFYNKKIVGKEVYVTVEEGVRMIKSNRNTAFFTFVDEAYDYMKSILSYSELDELQEILAIENNHRALLYVPIAKNSPFKELIRVGVLKLIETGVRSYVVQRWTSAPPVGDLRKWKIAEVDFGRCSSIFYMLLLSYLLSIIIFLGEIWMAKIEKKRKNE